MKNCPNCNRTLVEGPDHSLKCIFCGWSAAAEVAQAEQEEEKMKQTAEAIARQRIKEDTSKTPQIIIAVIAVVASLFFILSNYVFKGEDKPAPVVPSVKPTPKQMYSPPVSTHESSSEHNENTSSEASSEPSLEPTPEASPTEDPAAVASTTPTDAPENNKESALPDSEANSAATDATPEPSPS